MSKEIKIKELSTLTEIIFRFGTRISTEEGNNYYELPFWFAPDADGWILYAKEWPNDLMMFITKARLGGDNQQPKKVKL